MDQRSHSRFNDNLPAYLMSISSGGRAIYMVCIVLAIGILISLPLVSIPVSVTGQGIIRPELERAEIVLPVSGVVEEVFVKEGMSVPESTPILRIQSRESTVSMKEDMEELHEILGYLCDLE